MKIFYLIVLAVILAVGLGACRQKNHAPVITNNHSANYSQGVHTVHQGETLYSIAWQYGFDYQELAAINSINPPYPVYPGQKIRFFADKSKPAKIFTRHLQQQQAQKQHEQHHSSTLTWTQPTRGKIIEGFRLQPPSNKGINIEGKLGQKIVAAADGHIVYTGSGLPMYGQLVIIKHDKKYLSAYAFNRRIVVQEGQTVKKGQKIAEMGKNNSQQVMLHFEIRAYGHPVDPTKHIPIANSI